MKFSILIVEYLSYISDVSVNFKMTFLLSVNQLI